MVTSESYECRDMPKNNTASKEHNNGGLDNSNNRSATVRGFKDILYPSPVRQQHLLYDSFLVAGHQPMRFFVLG